MLLPQHEVLIRDCFSQSQIDWQLLIQAFIAIIVKLVTPEALCHSVPDEPKSSKSVLLWNIKNIILLYLIVLACGLNPHAIRLLGLVQNRPYMSCMCKLQVPLAILLWFSHLTFIFEGNLISITMTSARGWLSERTYPKIVQYYEADSTILVWLSKSVQIGNFKRYLRYYNIISLQNVMLQNYICCCWYEIDINCCCRLQLEFIKSPRSNLSSHRVLTENTEAIHELSPVTKILR